jgi:ubiquinone/menaquinone biosynthesis C-methylase UbiE
MKVLEIKDSCRANFNKYTKLAFESIPKMENPNILDLGCGTGVPTLEIARMTNGNILAIDSDKRSLEWFKKKVQKLNYGKRISIIHDSILTVNLSEHRFDIILAEGIFNIIGFEKGLSTFHRLLNPDGYFMIHDEFKNRERKKKIFEKYQLKEANSFILDEKVWRDEYIHCLEKKIWDYEKTHEMNSKDLFIQEKSEIEMYKKNPLEFRSIYYVLQNRKGRGNSE